MSSRHQKEVKPAASPLEGKEPSSCLVPCPTAQSYRPHLPQSPFLAVRTEALSGRGDRSTEGLQILMGKYHGSPWEGRRGPATCPKPPHPTHLCACRHMPSACCKTYFFFNFLVGLANHSCSFPRAQQNICLGSHLHTVGLFNFLLTVCFTNKPPEILQMARTGAGCGTQQG